jgi:hypothetical protein
MTPTNDKHKNFHLQFQSSMLKGLCKRFEKKFASEKYFTTLNKILMEWNTGLLKSKSLK